MNSFGNHSSRNVINRRTAITLGAAFMCYPLAFSGTAWAVSTDQRVADLAKAGRIRAAFAPAPIMASKDPATGELHGVAVDLARELAARIGVELQQVVYPRPGAIMDGLRSNAWDVAFLGIDPARAAEADFSPAYMEVDLTFMVPGVSAIDSIAKGDQPGMRIAVPRGDLVDILLSRMIKRAELVRADTVSGVFDLFKAGKADICALPRPNLLLYSAQVQGLRVLDDRFGVNRVGVVIPKGWPGHLAYCSEFIEQAKSSGLVQRTIEKANLRGVQVAPRG